MWRDEKCIFECSKKRSIKSRLSNLVHTNVAKKSQYLPTCVELRLRNASLPSPSGHQRLTIDQGLSSVFSQYIFSSDGNTDLYKESNPFTAGVALSQRWIWRLGEINLSKIEVY